MNFENVLGGIICDMAEVKWVKITTDMFDNRKIRQIRHLPEGNNIVLIWVMLLTIAGRCNSNGMIFLTESILYTPESLALELGFDVPVVLLALETLKNFGMIVCDEEEFCITNWCEYQNIDGLDKIREQNRLRQKKWYDKQKELPNVRSNVILTEPNATDKDIEKDLRNKIKNIYEEFADGDSELLQALKEHEAMRKRIKKPMEEGAKKRLLSALQKFPREQWVQILNQSTDHCWLSVFPLDSKQAPKPVAERRFVPTDL